MKIIKTTARQVFVNEIKGKKEKANSILSRTKQLFQDDCANLIINLKNKYQRCFEQILPLETEPLSIGCGAKQKGPSLL